MNKRGEEDNHWSTYTGVFLILFALLGLLIFYSDSLAQIKKGFEKVADKETIEKAYEKTLGKEEALTEEEKKIIDQFNLFFKNNFIIEDDDCIKQINFDEIKGKGFGIGVRGGNIFAEKEERARVYPLIAPFRLLAMYFDEDAEKIDDDFFIDENFEKINNKIELEDVAYIKTGKIYLLDKATTNEFSGVVSNVVRKDVCGADVADMREELKIVNVDFEVVSGTSSDEAQDVAGYLNDEFSYLGGNYKIYEMIKYMLELRESISDRTLSNEFPTQKKYDLLMESLGNHIEDYFGEEYRGLNLPSENKCWFATVSRESSLDVITFGNSKGPNLKYREAKITLSDGSVIDFILSVSRDGCLPAVEIDKLLEPYRTVGAPGYYSQDK